MITARFLSFDAARPGWDRCFKNPRSTRAAHRLAEVVPVLAWAEDNARRGRWVAVAVAYEAAPALDPALSAHAPGSFPLVWAAAFDRPTRPPAPAPVAPAGDWAPALSYPAYARRVRRIKALIARGHTYQVNLTFPLRRAFRGDAWGWFHHLGRAQAAPHAAYLDLGRWKILSLSPELFFSRTGDRLTLRPMKGSAPRGRWPAEDEERARALAASDKDRAENLMIVDLLRNDAGKIARPGGVRVRRLFTVERYPTVHHLTSTVEARLRAGVGLADVFRALFPSGSVTGAPKPRTLEIIRELEPGPRGVYTGAIGLLEPGGKCAFNVAIRTVTVEARRAVCPVGGGVTWGSSPRGEYDEALLKGRFLSAAPRAFDLLESLRLESGRYPLWPGHRDRLRSSARFWGFACDMDRVARALRALARRHAAGTWKVRLRVSPAGAVRAAAEPLGPLRPWRVALSPAPVDDGDARLFHKTTDRAVYDRHAARCPGADDVLLWNARGEITESTRANVLVEKRGRWYTPPVASGLLAGVYRRKLIAAGRVREKVLRPEDLRAADRVCLVNAVRGWIPVVVEAPVRGRISFRV